MALIKWEPFAGLTTLQREMNHLFESFFDYQVKAWFGPVKSPPVPPNWDLASDEARVEMLKLAQLSSRSALPEPLRRKINLTAKHFP